MARQRLRKRPMHEINVVPYIDVMLVLLVIFMITAPLLAQGVKVELPRQSAEPLPPDEKEPVIVSVDAAGRYFVNVGDEQHLPVDAATLKARVAAALKHRAGTPVLVRGDRNVEYGRVVGAMVLLQEAGAPGVGLMTRPPDTAPGG